MSEEEILEHEYKYFFEDLEKFPEMQSPLYQILINNNLPLDSGILMSSKV